MGKGAIDDKNILLLVREADAIENELDKAKDKFSSQHDKINMNSHYCFNNGAGVRTLKCAIDFNYYVTKNKK